MEYTRYHEFEDLLYVQASISVETHDMKGCLPTIASAILL